MKYFYIILLLSITSCGGGSVPSLCPPPVWADQKVAEELDTIPFEGYEDTWDWIAQVERLNEQLEACR